MAVEEEAGRNKRERSVLVEVDVEVEVCMDLDCEHRVMGVVGALLSVGSGCGLGGLLKLWGPWGVNRRWRRGERVEREGF